MLRLPWKRSRRGYRITEQPTIERGESRRREREESRHALRLAPTNAQIDNEKPRSHAMTTFAISLSLTAPSPADCPLSFYGTRTMRKGQTGTGSRDFVLNCTEWPLKIAPRNILFIYFQIFLFFYFFKLLYVVLPTRSIRLSSISILYLFFALYFCTIKKYFARITKMFSHLILFFRGIVIQFFVC